jgi:hypothetical protein
MEKEKPILMRSLRAQVYLLPSRKEAEMESLPLIAVVGVVAWWLGYAAGRRTHKPQE